MMTLQETLDRIGAAQQEENRIAEGRMTEWQSTASHDAGWSAMMYFRIGYWPICDVCLGFTDIDAWTDGVTQGHRRCVDG